MEGLNQQESLTIGLYKINSFDELQDLLLQQIASEKRDAEKEELRKHLTDLTIPQYLQKVWSIDAKYEENKIRNEHWCEKQNTQRELNRNSLTTLNRKHVPNSSQSTLFNKQGNYRQQTKPACLKKGTRKSCKKTLKKTAKSGQFPKHSIQDLLLLSDHSYSKSAPKCINISSHSSISALRNTHSPKIYSPSSSLSASSTHKPSPRTYSSSSASLFMPSPIHTPSSIKYVSSPPSTLKYSYIPPLPDTCAPPLDLCKPSSPLPETISPTSSLPSTSTNKPSPRSSSSSTRLFIDSPSHSPSSIQCDSSLPLTIECSNLTPLPDTCVPLLRLCKPSSPLPDMLEPSALLSTPGIYKLSPGRSSSPLPEMFSPTSSLPSPNTNTSSPRSSCSSTRLFIDSPIHSPSSIQCASPSTLKCSYIPPLPDTCEPQPSFSKPSPPLPEMFATKSSLPTPSTYIPTPVTSSSPSLFIPPPIHSPSSTKCLFLPPLPNTCAPPLSLCKPSSPFNQDTFASLSHNSLVPILNSSTATSNEPVLTPNIFKPSLNNSESLSIMHTPPPITSKPKSSRSPKKYSSSAIISKSHNSMGCSTSITINQSSNLHSSSASSSTESQQPQNPSELSFITSPPDSSIGTFQPSTTVSSSNSTTNVSQGFLPIFTTPPSGISFQVTSFPHMYTPSIGVQWLPPRTMVIAHYNGPSEFVSHVWPPYSVVNQYGPSQNQYGPSQNQYGPSQNQYGPSQNQYIQDQYRYRPHQYLTNCYRYTPNQYITEQYMPSQGLPGHYQSVSVQQQPDQSDWQQQVSNTGHQVENQNMSNNDNVENLSGADHT